MSTGATTLEAGTARVRRRPAWLRYWPLLPIVAFLLLFFVYPTALLLGQSAYDTKAHLTLHNYDRLLHTDLYINGRLRDSDSGRKDVIVTEDI